MMIDRPTIAGRAETARALARAIDDLRRGVDLPVQDLAAALARRILALGSGLDRPAAPAARADLRRAELVAETDLAADLRDARSLDRRLAPIAGRRARVADRALRDVAQTTGPNYARDVVRAIEYLPDSTVDATGEQADRRRATVRAVVAGARWARRHLYAPIGGATVRDYHGRISESAPVDRPSPVAPPAPPDVQWARIAILAVLRGDGTGDCRLSAEVMSAPRLWAAIVRAAIVAPTDGVRWISSVRAACAHLSTWWTWGAATAARLAWSIADDLRIEDHAEVRADLTRVDLAIGRSIASRSTGARVAPRGADLESAERTSPRDPSVVAGRTIPAVRPHVPARPMQTYRGPRSTYLPADLEVRAQRPTWSVAGLVYEPEPVCTAPAADGLKIAPITADSGPRRGKRSTVSVRRRQAVPVAAGD